MYSLLWANAPQYCYLNMLKELGPYTKHDHVHLLLLYLGIFILDRVHFYPSQVCDFL